MLDRAILEGLKAMPSIQDVDEVGMRVLERLRESAPDIDMEPHVQTSRHADWLVPVVGTSIIVLCLVAWLTVLFKGVEPAGEVVLKTGTVPTVKRGPDGVKSSVVRPPTSADSRRNIRNTESTGQTLTLADGSRVELAPLTELSIGAASGGEVIYLATGSIVVTAAGHLYVETGTCTASVVGAVFSVRSASRGSRVSVFEGVVRVEEKNGAPQLLGSGQQFSTGADRTAVPLEDEIAWSSNAAGYLALLQPPLPPPLPPVFPPPSGQRPQGRGGGRGGTGRGGVSETIPDR
jgi:hypothetical protein